MLQGADSSHFLSFLRRTFCATLDLSTVSLVDKTVATHDVNRRLKVLSCVGAISPRHFYDLTNVSILSLSRFHTSPFARSKPGARTDAEPSLDREGLGSGLGSTSQRERDGNKEQETDYLEGDSFQVKQKVR
jgi:hypothetical protein